MTIENKRAKSFVTIMVVIAICALLLRIAIERLIKINIAQNDSNASSTLKSISAALENYAKDNKGTYPTNLLSLTQTKPPYLDKEYVAQSSIKGYNFSCGRLEPSGYICTAAPIKCKLTGKMIYTITTGSLLVSEDCNAKE